ncbi:MAG TPA: aminoglycoside phosphotransferase family protein [Candidatus Limnocylindrales bacterium]|nr:aminoglycoside phosphotransferase family protein [Candidatus Limnocylindrales bacterium]
MLGGITSSVHRVSVRVSGGSARQVVLKRYTNPGWGDVTRIATNEVAALTAAEAIVVPAPRLLGASTDGADTEGVPTLLMTRAPGHVWLTPDDLEAWIRQLAALLPRIHEGAADVRPKLVRDAEALRVPRDARRPEVWAAAKRAITAGPPSGERVFVHGDYQHFNMLWARGRLAAIVDWSGSRIGSPDLDVGHCRLNLAVLFDADAAEQFRRAYEAEAGRAVDPWWDVHQLLAYDDTWQDFIPVQVAGRAPVAITGMTARVEELLALALGRL